MTELEKAIEDSKAWLNKIKGYIGGTGYWETEGALRLVIEAAERSEADINFSFLQKVREECKKYYNPNDTVNSCRECKIRKCIHDYLPLAVSQDKELITYIEKVLEQTPKIAKTGGGE